MKNLLFYILFIGGFILFIYFTLDHGGIMDSQNVVRPSAVETTSPWAQFVDTFSHNLKHPLSVLLLQIITIIVTARIFGSLCRKIGQPTVIGEILAGIFLGPSFIGMYFPEFSVFIFPAQSLSNLQFLSQIGLILFMFIVGMELDLKVLKNKGHEAIVVSHASIVFPFALGVLLALYIYKEFAPPDIPFHSFGLFLGIAMSITAFPVLARIVQERGLSKTKLGALVITCAAADDITAWCILAAVIAIVKAGTFTSALFTIGISIAYVIVMIRLVQPFLKKIGDIYSNREGLSKPIVAIFLATLILSSYATEILGIHALFGAFMAGVMMPPNINFRSLLIEKVEDVSVVLLLPLFFVFTGLRTEINLMDNAAIWGVCGLIILVAVVGKFLGSALAARFVGQSWRESLSIGALMNTRGLMELVVLNIGYDLGILTPPVFAMMVIMALVTTFMTGPALDIINRFLPQPTPNLSSDALDHAGKYKILLSFGDPERGSKMLMLAASFINRTPANASITALHFSPANELNQYNISEYESESFEPIKREAQRLNVPLITLFKPSPDIEKDMVLAANVGNFDLMIIGIGQSVFEGTLLGRVLGFTTRIINPGNLYGTLTGREKMFSNIFDDRTRSILRSTKIPVGIFIDKGLNLVKEIVIPLLTEDDSKLLPYAQKLISNSDARVSIYDLGEITKKNAGLKESIRLIEQTAPHHITLFTQATMAEALAIKPDLLLITLKSWTMAIQDQYLWLSQTPSALVLKV